MMYDARYIIDDLLDFAIRYEHKEEFILVT